MDGDWCEERPTLIDSYGWALNPGCFYLNLPMILENVSIWIEFFHPPASPVLLFGGLGTTSRSPRPWAGAPSWGAEPTRILPTRTEPGLLRDSWRQHRAPTGEIFAISAKFLWFISSFLELSTAGPALATSMEGEWEGERWGRAKER